MSFYRILFVVLEMSMLFHNNVYSQNNADKPDSLLISDIIIEGNKKTKEHIILRELLFKKGDMIDAGSLEYLKTKSEENLLNTSLFNFVTIEIIPEYRSVQIVILLQERWYVWPYPVLEQADRNFSSFLRNQEWSRIDYGLFVLVNNFRGHKEILKLKMIFGYNNRFALYCYKPFVDKQQKVGFGIDIDFFRNHEVPFNILKSELIYLKMNDSYARKTLKLSNFYTYRPHLYTSHLLNIKFSTIWVADSVFALNNQYFWDNTNEVSFFTLGYIYNYDKRDSKVYPLTGYRIFLSAVKNGLGVVTDKGNFEVKSVLEKNIKIHPKFYANTSLIGSINFSNQKSFYFSEAIGYNNYLRGMEYYVTNGESYYISKTNLKYEILPQTKLNLNFIPTDKFSKVHIALYANVFMDTGYANSEFSTANSIANEFLYSGGFGIDFVTYYDKVLRIEYSLNKFGEHGIFVHLGAPIIEK